MENQMMKNKFELSVVGALGILIVYDTILRIIIGIPFSVISEDMYFKAHEISQAAIAILGEVIPYIIIVKLISKRIRRKQESNFNIKYFERFNFKLVVCTIFLMTAFFLWYQSSIGILMEKIPVPEFIEESFENLFQNPYAALVSITIIAPIFEEILFRGIILEGFLNKYNPITAIIASAILFGLIHLNIPQFSVATFMGLIFGAIYYKTRSLILCIIGHAVNNTMALVLNAINFSPGIICFFVGTVIFVITAKLFIKYIDRMKSSTEEYLEFSNYREKEYF